MIRAGLAVLGFFLWASFAAAQDALPALHDVTGVAADDVLNVRAAPRADAPRVGSLAPDARGVEVVAANPAGTWGLVNVDERSGWISLRYVVRQPGQEDRQFPVPLSCYGTEPFWSLDLTETETTFELFSGATMDFGVGNRMSSANRTDRWAFAGEYPGAESFGVLARARCNDGMSDREYGLTADVSVGAGDRLQFFSGCCSLSRD